MSSPIAITPKQAASVDFTPTPPDIQTLLARWNNPNVSFNGQDKQTLETYLELHPLQAQTQKYFSAINEDVQGNSLTTTTKVDTNPFPTISQLGNEIQQSFSDPHTTYETLTNPLNNQYVQDFLRNQQVSAHTLGLSEDFAASDTVSTKYLSGDTPTDSDKTLAFQGAVKVGVIAATWGGASYLGAGAGAAADGAAIEGATATEDSAAFYAAQADYSAEGATLVDEGGYTFAADPANASIASSDLVQVDSADAALYELPGATPTPVVTAAEDASSWGLKDYLGASALGGSVASNLLKGNAAGAAGALGAPQFVTDLLPSGPSGPGGGTTLFPNQYQGSTQPQANSSVPLNGFGLTTNSKALVYLGIGLGLLFLLKRARAHG